MASKNIELKVGLLVIIGVAILLGAIYIAKGYQYGQEYYSISVWFPEVGALSPGDPVSISGVNKGKVKELTLEGGGVLTRMDLANDVVLKEDAQFTVKNIGLMGERFVAVRTGVAERKLDLARPSRGTFDAGIPEVMGMMGDVIIKMNDLATLLRQTVISPATLDKFSATVGSLHAVALQLEGATTRNVPKIDSTIGNFTSLSQSIRESWARNEGRFDTGAKNLDSASQRLLVMLNNMEDASRQLQTFATELEQSEGTLRMLMDDRRLYDDLRTTAKSLDSLVQDVRANPKKYINFSVEIF